jgi:hypothetical protein
MSSIVYVGSCPVTKGDLKRLKKMSRLAKQFSSLHSGLSGGCNYALFEMHCEDSSVNHIACVIQSVTDEAVDSLTRVFH